MGIEKTDAIVLNSRDWKETSKIVTFYTSSHGKLSAIAKGSKRKNSPFGEALQIFTYLNLVYYDRSDRDLQVVSQGTELESFQELREDLVKMAYASYFVQLVDEMVKGREPSGELFGLLLDVLCKLKGRVECKMLARFFELQFLKILGYNPMLRSCAGCGKDIGRDLIHQTRFSASAGGIVCGKCAAGVEDSMAISAGVYSGLLHLQSVDIEKLARFKLSHALSKELKTAMYYYLEYFLEKRLKSQDFLEHVIISQYFVKVNIR